MDNALEHRLTVSWNIRTGTSTDNAIIYGQRDGTPSYSALEHPRWNIYGQRAGTPSYSALEHPRWNNNELRAGTLRCVIDPFSPTVFQRTIIGVSVQNHQ